MSVQTVNRILACMLVLTAISGAAALACESGLSLEQMKAISCGVVGLPVLLTTAFLTSRVMDIVVAAWQRRHQNQSAERRRAA